MTVTVAGAITGGTLLSRLTVAEDEPAAFIAVTISVPEAGIVAGAVYKPDAVTVPETAVQLVAPGAANC
jgi:hypothetical protein